MIIIINSDFFLDTEIDTETEIDFISTIESKIKDIDILAYEFYCIDYHNKYIWHDSNPASKIDIMNHYYYNKCNPSHSHDSIDDYYERANKILRKQKLDKLDGN